jgi:hypothetical protein
VEDELRLVQYVVYLAASIALTVWVGRSLHANGRRFLVDVMRDEGLADSVNHLLVVGFYLINIGYVALALKYGVVAATPQESLETLSTKVGLVLLVLGGMHFFNLYVFAKMRRRALRPNQPPVIPASNALPRGHSLPQVH